MKQKKGSTTKTVGFYKSEIKAIELLAKLSSIALQLIETRDEAKALALIERQNSLILSIAGSLLRTHLPALSGRQVVCTQSQIKQTNQKPSTL
jgi:hypothetical protein